MFTEVPPAAPSPQSVGKPVPGNRDSGLWFVLTLFKPQRSPGPGVQLPENRDGHVGHRQDVPVEPDPSAIGYLAPSLEQLRLASGTACLVLVCPFMVKKVCPRPSSYLLPVAAALGPARKVGGYLGA